MFLGLGMVDDGGFYIDKKYLVNNINKKIYNIPVHGKKLFKKAPGGA